MFVLDLLRFPSCSLLWVFRRVKFAACCSDELFVHELLFSKFSRVDWVPVGVSFSEFR